MKTKSNSTEASKFEVVSMTGFGRASAERAGRSVSFEIRAVNSRFLDPIMRLPKDFSALEPTLRRELGSSCHRGRVEVTLSVELLPESGEQWASDAKRFEGFLACCEELLKEYGLWTKEVKERLAADVLLRKDFIAEGTADPVSDEEGILAVFRTALQNLRKAQRAEGAALAEDIIRRRARVAEVLERIAKLHEGQRERYEQQFRTKLKELLETQAIPEERLIGEVALLTERSDISEEVTRLQSHLERFLEIAQEVPCGRKLDFLLQECVREMNTIAAKVQHAESQHLVVEAKTELERMKEQVQNIE